jgi:hypothetical protein
MHTDFFVDQRRGSIIAAGVDIDRYSVPTVMALPGQHGLLSGYSI